MRTINTPDLEQAYREIDPALCSSQLRKVRQVEQAEDLAIATLRRGQCLAWYNLDAAAAFPASVMFADLQDISSQLEEAEAFCAALSRLPDPYRRALILSYHGALKTAQLAQIIGITPGGCKMLLVRARGAFARHYGTQKEVSA